jgi:cytochrome c peroxidase
LSFREKDNANGNTSKEYIHAETKKIIEVFDRSLACLDSLKDDAAGKRLKELYTDSRKHYKHLECFMEYYSPHDAKYFINGPLVKKSELEYGKKVYEPRGMQVLEELLFDSDSLDRKALSFEYVYLREAFNSLAKRLSSMTLDESRVFDMVQFELYRVSCVTLNGYDATITQTNPAEAGWSLEGCEYLLASITGPTEKAKFSKTQLLFDKAEIYCKTAKSNDSFDRLYFVTRFVRPLYKEVVLLRKELAIPQIQVNYALNMETPDMFGTKMFNPLFFSVNTKDTVNNDMQAELGKFLFYDPVLSGNNRRACASCHQSEKGFADGLQKAVAFNKDSFLTRNTPGLLNAMYQRNFFLDGRSRQLEQQVNDVLHNKNEMNSTVEEVVARLNKSSEYRQLFRKAFAGTPDTAIGYYDILKAITEYERTLDSRNSRFDKYLRGNYTQLTPAEINGYNIFSGKALCASCHFMPLFTGLVPPYFNDTEFEVIGAPAKKDNKEVDPDQGRSVVSKVSIHDHAFKSTTVRNIAITAPYMHNGVYTTVDEILEFYNKGGGNGFGFNLPNQTLPFDSLQLDKKEMSDIKAFLLSLTDTSSVTGKPKRLPRFEEESLNKRTIGGEY